MDIKDDSEDRVMDIKDDSPLSDNGEITSCENSSGESPKPESSEINGNGQVNVQANEYISNKTENSKMADDKDEIEGEKNKPDSHKEIDKKDVKNMKEDTKESCRSETPPLKRLMRQDPLPLFMKNHSHSPPKKVFKEEHSHPSKWQIPLIPSSAFLSSVKNAPMHPRQHMLKSKPYSNRIFLSPAALSSIHTMGYPANPKVYDNDQPLDLSKKTGGTKSSSSTSRQSTLSKSSSHSIENIHLKSRHKYSNGLFPESVKSSLQSLQQKFGGDFHTRLLQKPMKSLHSMSYDMYTKTCNNDNVLLNSITSPPKKKSPVPPYTEKAEKSLNEKVEPSSSGQKDLNSNFKKPISASGSESDEDKHTRHKCVCSKSFNSLYDLSLHIQETGHLPAGVKKANLMEYPKLVRGQDMWLNTESEQTKRILRCMQCNESFKSLPMLTVHMMQTQHYTKIVSSEHGRRAHKCSTYCDREMERECVFKCKVCNSMFVDMEGLANHMILSGHHKRNILRTQNHSDFDAKAKHQFNEDFNSEKESSHEMKRKPLLKLSPLHDRLSASSPESDILDDSMISCENCGDKIETNYFVEHVRSCLHHSMVDAFESRIQKLKSKVDNLQTKNNKDLQNPNENSEIKELKSDLKLNTIKTENSGGDDLDINLKQHKLNDDKQIESSSSNHIKSEPLEESNIEKSIDETQDSKSNERNPSSVESAKQLDILNPEATDEPETEGNSALQAMESFIQKSFSSKFTYGRNKFQVNLLNGKPESLSPLLKFEKYRKYFQPSLMMENVSKKVENTEFRDHECHDDNAKDELEKLEKLCENVNKRQSSPKMCPKMESTEQKDTKTSTDAVSNKYLNIDEEEQTVEKSSALDSLSSFVYGQSLDSEHPLDSLQKLITKTDIPGISHRHQPVFNGSPESSIPLNLSVKKEFDEEDLMEDGLSDGSHSDSGSDSAVEYHCVACSRHFASKGTYRYHLSRCHLSTIKKYGIKEAFNMSPYVYLPLDHTAKFSKYFKMAEELAKKEKL